MLSTTVSAYIWAVYFRGGEDYSLYYKLDVIDATLGLAFLPFVYLYLRTVTDETPLGWKDYILFLPAILVGLGSFATYAYLGDACSSAYLEQLFLDKSNTANFTAPIYKIHYIINVFSYYAIFVVQLIGVGYYAIVCSIRYRKRLEGFYSNLNDKSLENIKAMLIGVFMLLLTIGVGFIELYVFYFESPLLVYLLMLGYAGVLYYLNYYVFKLKYTAEDLAESLRNTDENAEEKGYFTANDVESTQKPSDVIKKGKRENILLQIDSLLNDDKVFLKKDLRLDDIVNLTQTNRTYISLLIKEEFQCGFSDLINRKRVEYAQEYVLTQPHISHHQLAEKSGFSHPSSFSRAFKLNVGVTFKMWHKTTRGTK